MVWSREYDINFSSLRKHAGALLLAFADERRRPGESRRLRLDGRLEWDL
jgi:hypothetical protein